MKAYLAVFAKTLVFEGRTRRDEYWKFTVVNLVILGCLAMADQAGSDASAGQGIGWMSGVFALLIFLPQTAVTIRRLHDTNRGAWWALVSAIPMTGVFALMAMAAIEGDRGPNRFGPDPRGQQDSLQS